MRKGTPKGRRYDVGYDIENRVADLHDEGVKPRAIAALTGQSEANVRRIIRYMCDSRAELWQREARKASQAMVAALARAHPERVSA